MQIKLDASLIPRLDSIAWLAHCGESPQVDFGLPIRWVPNRTDALLSAFSAHWATANNQARGCLTEYLSEADYDSYGTYWGELTKECQRALDGSIAESVRRALTTGGWPASMADAPFPELTRGERSALGTQMVDQLESGDWTGCLERWILFHAALALLEKTYLLKFRKAPVFFEHLLRVYEAGHVPCGWEGDVECWPEGKLIVH